ncbi:MAG TPA: hypothetical protein DGJ56_02610 [Verrucomicrobiales bacterium]|nr:hypothetical protein [Verrucomicrobiales bacterium]
MGLTSSKLIEGNRDTINIEGVWTRDGSRYVYNHFTSKKKWDLSIFNKETGSHEPLMTTDKTDWGRGFCRTTNGWRSLWIKPGAPTKCSLFRLKAERRNKCD